MKKKIITLYGAQGRAEVPKNYEKRELCHHFYVDEINEVEGLNIGLPRENLKIRTLDVWCEFPPHHESDIEFYFEVQKSLLRQNSATTCTCLKCSRQFPIENIEKMSRLFERMNELRDLRADEGVYRFDIQILNLLQELEPTWFIKQMDGKITVLDVEKNPQLWGFSHLARDGYEFPAVLQLPKVGERDGRNRYVCNHFWGSFKRIEAYMLLKEPWTEKDKKRLENPENRERGALYNQLKEKHYYFFPHLCGGSAQSLLFTNPYGECKCSVCKKVFTPQEQKKLEKLIEYLKTPHYWDEKTRTYHQEWKAVLHFYDEGYKSDNEPYEILKTEKILELFQGIEPVLYRKTHRKNKTEILKKLEWDGEKWIC